MEVLNFYVYVRHLYACDCYVSYCLCSISGNKLNYLKDNHWLASMTRSSACLFADRRFVEDDIIENHMCTLVRPVHHQVTKNGRRTRIKIHFS